MGELHALIRERMAEQGAPNLPDQHGLARVKRGLAMAWAEKGKAR